MIACARRRPESRHASFVQRNPSLVYSVEPGVVSPQSCGAVAPPRHEEETMESFAFVFPVLPGKAEQARTFGKEVMGPRASEMDASRRPLGVTREAAWVNQTPTGDIGIALIEAENAAEANRRFAEST